MLNFIAKLFGGAKSEKDVKEIQPLVAEINKICKEYDSIPDSQLAAKTDEFKAIIRENSKELEDEKTSLLEKLRNEVLTAEESHDANDRLKEIEKELFTNINDTLDELLPQAFATVKQVCIRLTNNKHKYIYAGQESTWAMIPYDVQLIGGVVIHQGKVAEMQTGEGKTLVAIMPMYLNALAGKGVHLVTVNDYLAKRDCEWMKPIFDFLGIEVGAIQSNDEGEERAAMYRKDITYGTNNEFGFDYLRDNMVVEADQMVQREHWFAIVDEVDSVLIDEARTPLIISGPVGASDQKFDEMNPRIKRLVDAQTKLVNQLVSDASNLLASGKKEDKEALGLNLLRAFRALPKHKRLAKLLQDTECMRLKHQTEIEYLKDQGSRMGEVDEVLFYNVDEKTHNIDITDKGRELLVNGHEDPDMFLIPDITTEMSQIEGDTSITPEEKQAKIDKANFVYAERSDRIHTLNQLLRAYSLYEKDVEYVIQDQKVMIVDEHTGRILEGRRYSDGLHQAIEAKENVNIERDTQTFATITLQNYFRLYHKLAGMTGTAETEAAELDKIYKLDVVAIPTNRPMTRKDQNDVIYKTRREKYNAIVSESDVLLKQGRAILVGTASVEVSEVLSKMFSRQGIKHNVLNAKQHQKEAEIISNAGRKGALTIATNMAGRGTDIKIDEDVRKAGGLAIIGSERHESRRIDRQLRGRSGRQGDPGSSKFYISLEDNLIRLFGAGGDRIANIMDKLNIPEGEAIEHSMVTKSVERAQKKVEENNFGIRKRLLDYDDVMNQQREGIYARRKHALGGERMRGELFEYLEELANDWFEDYHQASDIDSLKNTIRANILCEIKLTKEEFHKMSQDEFVELIINTANDFYNRKEEQLGFDFMKELEKVAILQTIDDKWREHLRAMDELKEGIHLRGYGQKDPLLEYKQEAFKMFVELLRDINKDSVNYAFRYYPQVIEREVVTQDRGNKNVKGAPVIKNSTSTKKLKFEHSDVTPSYAQPQQQSNYNYDFNENEGEMRESSSIQTFQREESKLGRNDIVKVRYKDGSIQEGKLKKYQKDIDEGKCMIL